MDQLYAAIESRIDQVIDALNDGFYSNCAQASRSYDVPVRRLQRRFKGVDSRTSRAPTNKALAGEQEQAIMRYIDQLDKANMSARHPMIVGAANHLLRFENRRVGHQWLSRFLDRNPQFNVRKQKPLDIDRKNSHSVEDMTAYFTKLETAMKEKGISELDVWNMDETGFRIGCGRAHLVITLDPNKPLRISSAGEAIPFCQE